ncbi:competence pheromone ComX [Bacillus atrophaeus]|uniref:competence pheromone ComX n=1 Tax=Bacillus atrophaeus TaxID=1452 RepID=UPI000D041FF2|nr:competence pheromone ComX [Bacillus atrophaeus]MCY8506573.1 competence pheromone ComX [Bacillus atrophaeus]MCY8916042.1 competence pheromone ComX [Bacillus atrophaeus]MCY8923916.1 competence pheromone ComX [Bacillus atrophaeus]MCY8948355.1 competence pheromone ComX [Bacillus atrophaeus]MCY8966772.1 competence pheromone ComX [Bacillus atrophaeus]
MQEIVGYLVKYPDVLEEVIEGRASLLNVNKDQLKSIVDAFKGLQVSSTVHWIPN